ncbi:hypothetical protein [Pseudomonas fluorescens]|uniref:hypothetical protein n=1 Tax=Pseudomonas fluorescens TaxID=294 RepID=UPI0012425BA3|nr:hypothetical protein [Pseudomonas fluorescens]
MSGIRYRDVSDDYKVRYAEYVELDGVLVQEILDVPYDPAKRESLVSRHRTGQISALVIKRGFCWAEDYSGGFTTHIILQPSNLLESPFLIRGGDYSRGLCSEFDKVLARIAYAFDVTGSKREASLNVFFGSRVPVDYYGTYDYSKYPRGYSPSVAFYGE